MSLTSASRSSAKSANTRTMHTASSTKTATSANRTKGHTRSPSNTTLDPPSVGTVTSSELHRMKLTATGELDRLLQTQAAEKRAADAEAHAKASARIHAMRKLEDEARERLPPSELEQLKLAEKAAVVSNAERALLEEHDDVKRMNQLTRYAKVMAIRDAQIQEKKVIEKERLEEERRLDTMMEIERQKSLYMYAERDARRAADQKLGAQVIVDQLEARERERLRQLELQDQEREALVRQNQELKEKEARAKLETAKRNKLILHQVAVSNAQQIQIKERAKKVEKQEDARVQAYIRNREAREARENAEKAAVKAERERETARLRAMQQKSQDKAAEADALRAKRATEDAERAHRKKEREDAERRAANESALNQARLAQKLEKERRLIEQAQQEKLEFDRVLRVQREVDEEERSEKQRRTATFSKHNRELQTQIVMNAELRKRNRMDFLNHGLSEKQRSQGDRLKLETIKAEKLDSLLRSGVPAKYTVELQSMSFDGR